MDLMLTEKAAYRVERASGAAPEEKRMLASTKARSRMGAAEADLEIVADEAGFLALESADGRASRARSPAAILAILRLGPLRLGDDRTASGRSLSSSIMRVEGRAVLIRPLTIRKNHGLWKVASPLRSGVDRI